MMTRSAFLPAWSGLTDRRANSTCWAQLWNARVTSHISLAEVAARITTDAVLRAIRLTDGSMRKAGFARPRIAVAGLNPHAGDGGNFGREEIDAIEPAVAQARADGIATEGPFPADTVFLRAKGGAFDAVLTMYHDQGQIAMKLMGFDRGVTLLGGFDFPICTPAHGTAYDIAGQGIAGYRRGAGGGAACGGNGASQKSRCSGCMTVQRPRNTGFRRSLNASTPSRRSSVGTRRL